VAVVRRSFGRDVMTHPERRRRVDVRDRPASIRSTTARWPLSARDRRVSACSSRLRP